MRCLSCKYDLSHLTEHRCPECSRAFDPSDPSTFHASASARERAFWWITFALLCGFLISFAFMCIHGLNESTLKLRESVLMILFLMAIASPVLLWVLFKCRKAR